MSQPDVILEKKRDFSEVFNASFSFLAQEIKGLLRVIALYAGLPIIVVVIYSAFYTQNVMQSIVSVVEGMNQPVQTSLFMMFVTVLLSALLHIFLSGLTSAYLAVYFQIGRGGFRIEEVWSLFIRKLGVIIGYSFVAGILAFFGFIFFLIPGIFISVPFSLIVMVAVVEDRGLGSALSRCFQLVKSNWWVTFGILIVASLIISTLGFLFSMPAVMIGAVKGFLTASGKETGDLNSTGVVIATVIGQLGQYLIYPIFYLIIGIQYFNLREQKDMDTLHQKVSAISEQEQ